MNEPTWLKREILDEVHADQLKQHGGLPGLRDENALERPKNRWSYQSDGDLFDLAAAYGFGLATSHPYTDGRVAFLAMYVFLGLNDFDLEATQAQVVEVMLELASGSLDEAELAKWLRVHAVVID